MLQYSDRANWWLQFCSDCTALHCTALHWTVLHCTGWHYTELQCTALHTEDHSTSPGVQIVAPINCNKDNTNNCSCCSCHRFCYCHCRCWQEFSVRHCSEPGACDNRVGKETKTLTIINKTRRPGYAGPKFQSPYPHINFHKF